VDTTPIVIHNNDSVSRNYTITITGLPTTYNFEGRQLTIAANSTSQVAPTVNVTHARSPGDAKVGEIVVSDGTIQRRVDLIQRTKSMLVFHEIGISYVDSDDDDRDEDFNVESKTQIDLDQEVKPGSDVELSFEIENLFRDTDYDESEISDVTLKIDASDNDLFEGDFDDEYDIDDLEAKKKEKITVQFKIPDDIDAGDYDLEFTLEGEDGKNIRYKDVKTLRLDIKRERDDVRITKALVVPSTVSLCEGSFSLEVELSNLGDREQKQAALAIFNRELAINENIAGIDLDEFDDTNDHWSKTFRYTLKNSTKAKTYPIEVRAFIQNDKEEDTKIVNLVVEACPTSTTPTTPQQPTTPPPTTPPPQTGTSTTPVVTVPNTTTTQVPPTTNAPTQPTTTAPIVSVEEPYTSYDIIVALLIVGIVVLVMLIIVFIRMLL